MRFHLVYGKGLFKYILIALFFASHVVAQSRTDIFYPSGNYLIYGCGASTEAIKAILGQVHQHLQKAIETIESAGPSTETYNAFFRGVDPKIVTGVFRRIIAGGNIMVNGQPQHPSITCPHANHPMLREHWKLCEGMKRFAYHDESQFVFLCPRTLRLPAYPNVRDCVRRTNSKNRGISLLETQFTILLHELVHVYLNRPNLKPEVYGIFECLELPPEKSVANAGSYAFYIA
ncbi:MAG: hypothetical protein Q9187_006598, partial [Circinaria calcarea]